ncbi:MAG TPA: branched-chain amino acid ABC transporter permease [Acidimicrobiales bacterium]|nr:branched-chain amino acid ABC transporter permease [Acidimicrobiales bacterium]
MRRVVGALAALAALAVTLVGMAGGAAAQEQTDEGDAPSEAIAGTLRYDDESGEPVPAEGVELTVESADGSFSESGETDDEGRFEIAVPGPGTYSVTIDPDTLPEDVVLRNADRATLEGVELRAGQTRNVLFPIDFGEAATRDVSTTFDRFLRLLVDGIRFGLIIAMCAIGLSLIYGTTGLVNFSHGEMVTFGALVAFFFNVTLGWTMLAAAAAAVIVAGVAGGGLDRFFWRPLRNRGTGLIAMLVISIGLSILLRYIFNFQFGGLTRTYRQYTLQREGLDLGPVTIVPRDLIGMLLSVAVLVGVALFLQRTRIGKGMRAVSDNRDLAESSGIDVDRVINFVWVGGAALAALGGILHGLSAQVSWQMGFQLLLLMFAGVTLGGLGTAYGALVGSMVVGMVMEISTLYIPSEFKTVTALAILIGILIVRPQGILGQAERVG